MVNYCNKCGNKISEDSKFCSACGAEIKNDDVGEKKINDIFMKEIGNKSLKEKENTKKINEKINDNIYKPDDDFGQMFLSREGRLNRLRYFKRTILIGFTEVMLDIILGESLKNSDVIIAILTFCFLWPQYCLDVRRLKDINKSKMLADFKLGIGIYTCILSYNIDLEAIINYGINDSYATQLVGLGLAGCAVGLYLLFASGTNGKNQYGPDPLQNEKR